MNSSDKINFSLVYDYRTAQEKNQDEHFYDFKDGLNDDCDCGLCQYWREQESKDLENV